MKLVFFALFFLGKIMISNSQNVFPVAFTIELNTSKISKLIDLNSSITFKNNSDSFLLIPKYLQHGYKKGIIPYMFGDIIWEIEKNTKKGYIQQSVNIVIKQLPILLPENELYDTLLTGQKISRHFNLGIYYQLRRGSYRVRAKYMISLMVNKPKKYLYSKWVRFDITNVISYTKI